MWQMRLWGHSVTNCIIRSLISRADLHVVQGMAQSWDGEPRDAASSGTTFATGSVVNSRYRIERFVGRGGMGEVWRAHDTVIDRMVAIKVVKMRSTGPIRAERAGTKLPV